ncbi:MAG: hypothetical protein IPO88_12465 [Nannocystis sp.]|uniref:hypothetical protein n=1 Tax=Nannocystis sp. TaxID=1962667 RepID=UPI00242810DB|nr:hypothetical protein [Nannocystis sp.]MBK9754297.1 hypothetical protein [Nannocystis sp.]
MRRLVLASLVASLVALSACADEPDPTGLPEPLARHTVAAVPPPAAPAPAALPARIDTCEQLAVAAAVHPPDAAILLDLCPTTPTTPAILRHALRMADSPAAAAALAPRLAATPDLAGIARLVALDRADPSLAPLTELPDPVTATVSPVTDAVLAAVQLAIVQQTQSGLSQDQRTRATAYLARVHHEALLQLGLADEPLPPLARVLAGRFLHFGRELCRMYWQRRVAGLEALFASTEAQLLTTVLALERTPHFSADALLAVEHQRTRRHLQGSGVAERLARSGGPGPSALLPLLHEFDRLFDHRFVELVFQRALFLAGEPPSPHGVAPVAEMLRAQLADRDLLEYADLLERRIDETRALSPAPPEQGSRPLPPRVPLTWPEDQAIAELAATWLRTAASSPTATTTATAAANSPTELTRRHALARAALLLRDRPDAARALLRRELDAPARDPMRVGLLLDLLARLDDESLAGLRLRVAAAAPIDDSPASDDARRRAFALAARDARLLPR